MSIRITLAPAKYCEECGGESIPHKSTYATLVLDELLRPLFAPSLAVTSFFEKRLDRLTNKVLPSLVSASIRFGLAEYCEEPDDKTMLLALMLWNEAKDRGISVKEYRLFGLARNMFVATMPNGKTIVYGGIPMPLGQPERVWWLDNKNELKKRFKKLGFPISEGNAVSSEKEALDLFRKLGSPVIIKPYSGSGSRHTTLHIKDETELLRAFGVAKQVAPLALIEEELEGGVYRATVVNGKLVATLRRDPPSVVGDGVHTLRELVEEENKLPARQGPYFSHIHFDTPKAEAELAWQGLTPDSVPLKGRRVMFHQKINWGTGGGTEDVTDDVHLDNKELFEAAAKALNASIVGIDFIIVDIGKSWKEQKRCGIIECNSMPFFDNHHLPMRGKPRNVAAAIWDMNM
jgi:D-alanine-D-alanine ligase-like ATP-grasp enzyme